MNLLFLTAVRYKFVPEGRKHSSSAKKYIVVYVA